MIFTVLDNMYPLHSFDFLKCRTANITRPTIVNAKFIYVQILHSVLTSFCVITAPTSFTYCKARLATKLLSLLCLHNGYIAKVVTSREITAVANKQKNIYVFSS